MRRILGLVLVMLGVALLALAPALRYYTYDKVAQAPVDQESDTVSRATDATYLDVGSLTIQEGATLEATRKIRGDVEAAREADNNDVAIWDALVYVQRPGSDEVISGSKDRVAFDRHTSEAVDCCGAMVDDKPVEHHGIEYKFPFGVEKKTYQYFDVTLKRALPMRFVREETLEGMTVYRFVQEIPAEKISEIEVPGSLVGKSEPSVTLDRYYANTRIVWVEPTSGVIIKGREEQRATLGDETNQNLLTITDADFEFTQETTDQLAGDARDARDSIRLIRVTLPAASLALGAISLVGGLLLFLGGRRRRGAHAASDSEPALVGR